MKPTNIQVLCLCVFFFAAGFFSGRLVAHNGKPELPRHFSKWGEPTFQDSWAGHIGFQTRTDLDTGEIELRRIRENAP
jgi:hypothetical protein